MLDVQTSFVKGKHSFLERRCACRCQGWAPVTGADSTGILRSRTQGPRGRAPKLLDPGPRWFISSPAAGVVRQRCSSSTKSRSPAPSRGGSQDDGEDGGAVDGFEAGPMTGRDLGMLPGAAPPWRAADPRRRVPRARGPAPGPNGAACYSAARPSWSRLDEVRPAVDR